MGGTLATEEHREAFNPRGNGDGGEAGNYEVDEKKGSGGVGANEPYFPEWKKVTDGLQVEPGEELNDAIWRHLRGQKGVGTGFGGGALYSDHLAVTTEVEVAGLADGLKAKRRIGVCSFNISFQISDAGMWGKSFPSEVAATTVLNRQHAEAVAIKP